MINDIKPLITIVTPSFNQGQFIEETILSVLNQTYKNIQYIIVDGGSTDNTMEVVEKYRDRVSLISDKLNVPAKFCGGNTIKMVEGNINCN